MEDYGSTLPSGTDIRMLEIIEVRQRYLVESTVRSMWIPGETLDQRSIRKLLSYMSDRYGVNDGWPQRS